MSSRENLVMWIYLQQHFGVATSKSSFFLEKFSCIKELFSLAQRDLSSLGFFTKEEENKILYPSFSKAENILTTTEAFGAAVLTPDSPEYPEGLKNIYAPPMALYCLGDSSLLTNHYNIAMVGTRKPDEYGIAVAKKLSSEVAHAGGVVVSGLAAGVDAVCHRGALEAGGKTIAVIASGLDNQYPKKNEALRKLIEKRENGLVLSEYPLGTQARPFNFPLRNRLISGSSLATVIVQAAEKSGTMHTAAHAITQNRDLFAVPNSILSPISNGCNYLIKQGAEPALNGGELVERYQQIYSYPLLKLKSQIRQTSLFSYEEQPSKPKPKLTTKKSVEQTPEQLPEYLSEQQVAIMHKLKQEKKVAIDQLCESLSMEAGQMLNNITSLELFGLIKVNPGRIITLL